MELDAQLATDGTEHAADLCIVGAGPAGLALAHALADSGLNLVVVESGADAAGAARELNAGSTVGEPWGDLRESRGRAIGGTSSLWSTIRSGVLGAKYVALDPIDFMRRDELPWSGWPFARDALDPWYQKARSLLELNVSGREDSGDVRLASLRLPFRPDGLTTSEYSWGPAEVFRQRIPAVLQGSDRVVLIRNATVTELVGADAGRIGEVRWATLSGIRGTVRAARFVLAAGTIENARLLLLSRTRGREADNWLGRGLMEHPIDRSLHLVSRHPALSPDPGIYAPFGTDARARLIGRIGLSEGLMRDGRLWNAALRIFPVPRGRLMRAAARAMSLAGIAPNTEYRVLLDLEQAPHRENRVVLSDRRDAMGMPTVVVHWRWRVEDEANRQRVLAAVVREFGSTGSGRMQIVAGPPVDPDVHHHAGTTRMHADPALGVVRADLRVHDVENLYVVGASVFPTAGVANPVLTILALSLRLADRLRQD